MLTLMLLLVLGAFVTTIAAAMNKCPVWVPVFILCVLELAKIVPIGPR